MKDEMVLDRATAEIEFQRWADAKKLKPARLEELDAQRERVVDCLEDGSFSMDEECNITQRLNFPLDNISELVYKPRMTAMEFANLKEKSDMHRTASMLAAMSGKNIGIIYKLDSNDLAVASMLTPFYFVG